MPNGNNDYLIIILKPYVTKTYSNKVEVYGILLKKADFVLTKRECFHSSWCIILLVEVEISVLST